MRTKTPKQISTQATKLMNAIGLKHWNGKEYINHAAMMDKIDYIMETYLKYIDNIYRANGVDDRYCTAAVSNRIWSTAATPASIYTK